MFGTIAFLGIFGGAFTAGCLMAELSTTNDPKAAKILGAVTFVALGSGVFSLYALALSATPL